MRSVKRFSLVTVCFVALISPAVAGPYADDLAKCLVASTTSADKKTLLQWIFATASLHPDVKWMSTVADKQRAGLNRDSTALAERLLTRSCVKQAQQAVTFEGQSAIEGSFMVLGQVAGRELFSSPAVAIGLAEVGKPFEKDRAETASVRSGKATTSSSK